MRSMLHPQLTLVRCSAAPALGDEALRVPRVRDEIHGSLLEANRIRWYEALIAFFEKNLAPQEHAASSGAAAEPAP